MIKKATSKLLPLPSAQFAQIFAALLVFLQVPARRRYSGVPTDVENCDAPHHSVLTVSIAVV